MLAKDFYSISDESLSPGLEQSGWSRTDTCTYANQSPNGLKKLSLDPRRNFERFSVLISFEPTDISAFIRDVISEATYDRAKSGFLCGPYLNQVSVGRRRSEWPCKTKQQLLASLERVAKAVKEVGEPWLTSLMDAKTLAEQADPVAALVAGFAWERAGDMEKAAERYREMKRRFDEVQKRYPRLKPSEGQMKQYLFLASRLSFENEHTAKYRIALALAANESDA